MTLDARLRGLITETATQLKARDALRGDLADLATTSRSSLVSAINELHARPSGGGTSGPAIDDQQASTTTTYSSSRTDQRIAERVEALIGGAGTAYDTLLELQRELEGTDSDIAALVSSVSQRVSYVEAQQLTAEQAARARANIVAQDAGQIGPTDTDYAALLREALA